MKKKIILTTFLTISSLYASQIQYGKGNFEMSGGFIGMTQSLNTDITTYSLVEEHKNILSSDWYYKYNLTWYDSEIMTQMHDSVNGFLNMTPLSVVTPMIDYKMEGLDVNIVLGKDIVHKSENDYIGIGIMVGLSIPWIESEKSDSNNDSISSDILDLMQSSKTKMLTYKIGPSISLKKSINKHLMFYAYATYAYQKGSFENKYARFDLDVDGVFQEYDIGIKIQPVSEDYDMGWITISPRLYGTIGYRYSSWKLNDISMDITGANMSFAKTEFNMDTKIAYLGWGYSF